ncbi:hypothetical protein Goshw_011536 [Gossypium schwendimanii]|uniref:Uncharacterized protein n=1 Tax=Gossypium schwendimanii TaxID=34291 RepID=A0A7J9NEV6_GOSSC|nr:hypothetical protein [Gossypium schwendimanii]
MAYVTAVTIRRVEVPLFPGDICEFYDIPFSEKDFTDGMDLDRLQNIDMENGHVIRSPTRHAPSTGGSSYKEYAKGKGKAPMEKRQSPQWDNEEDD